ncbi:MAG TPA: zinc ribbon domain-containing protein, partial [Candidatus Binataceae bacterium]|nr:zinc ribbon domain-containing protein [Candidatus Binataceae bacterium]
MHCAKCGTDNPADASFCEHCGTRLEALCPSCKSPISAGARFCKKCGASLTSPAPDAAAERANRERSRADTRIAERVRVSDSTDAPPDGERKTVTALFADIKGSM